MPKKPNNKKIFEEQSEPQEEAGTYEEKKEGGEKPDEKNFQEQLEETADNIAKSISYARLKIWKEVLFHPTETLTDEIKNADLKRGAKDVFVAALIPLLLGFIILLLVFAYFGMLSLVFMLPLIFLGKEAGLAVLAVIAIGAVLVVVLYFASPIISWLFVSAVQYVVARLFGGKANFRTHAYLIALATASTTSAQIPFLVLSFVPCLNIIATPVRTLIGFYAVYLDYKAIRIAHGIGTPQAVVATLSPFALAVVLAIGLWLALYVGLLSLVFAPIAASPPAS